MTKWAAYIDIDKDVCAWTKCLIEDGFIAPGEVMCASIKDISHEVLRSFTQVHAFCGISVWSYALRQAGWPDDREIWSGSAPCQPFSVAGQQKGTDDSRHLWPDFFRLIDACRPARLFGEQVSGKAGYGWLDGVCADLESKDYACWAYDIPACAVDAPHIRNRLYWGAGRQKPASRALDNARSRGQQQRQGVVADVKRRNSNADAQSAVEHASFVGRRERRSEPELRRGWDAFAGADAPDNVAHTRQQHGRAGPAEFSKDGKIRADLYDSRAVGNAHVPILAQRKSISGDPRTQRATAQRTNDASFWSDAEWITCHDGKARRTQRGLPLLVDGHPGRIQMWKAVGNAICAPLAIEVIKAFMESEEKTNA